MDCTSARLLFVAGEEYGFGAPFLVCFVVAVVVVTANVSIPFGAGLACASGVAEIIRVPSSDLLVRHDSMATEKIMKC